MQRCSQVQFCTRGARLRLKNGTFDGDTKTRACRSSIKDSLTSFQVTGGSRVSRVTGGTPGWPAPRQHPRMRRHAAARRQSGGARRSRPAAAPTTPGGPRPPARRRCPCRRRRFCRGCPREWRAPRMPAARRSPPGPASPRCPTWCLRWEMVRMSDVTHQV